MVDVAAHTVWPVNPPKRLSLESGITIMVLIMVTISSDSSLSLKKKYKFSQVRAKWYICTCNNKKFVNDEIVG